MKLPDPLVSVLIPTRGRPQWLWESMTSLWETADNRGNVEFLLKVDDDDTATIDFLKDTIHPTAPVKVFTSPRGRGYAEIHHWINQLAGHAKGTWLLVWNDDARMLTKGWDTMVECYIPVDGVWHGAEGIICKVPTINGNLGNTAFFFLHRKVYEILGRLSYIPHCDTWVSSLMRMVDSLLYIPPIQVTHDEHHRDKVWQEGDPHRTTSEYTSRNLDGMGVKLQDALKLHKYIVENAK